MDISIHNVTKITQQRTYYDGVANDSGLKFYRLKIVVENDKGERVELNLFSDEAVPLKIIQVLAERKAA